MGEILMSYKVIGDSIVEKGTDLVVYKTSVIEEAMRLCRSLNLGAGFNGFTPSFFCLKYPVLDTKKPSTE
jgi:hypothetical protein